MSSPAPESTEDGEKQAMARIAWLQSLTSHRITTVAFSRSLYEHCCAIVQAPYSPKAYEVMLRDAAEHLSILDLELRRFQDQTNGKPMLALVNTKADTLIQGATRYSAQEISFLKRFIEEVFKARREAFSLPSLEAIRLGSKLRSSMTKDATEELLKNLVDHQWIDYSTEGIYTLSTRSLLELRNYLQNEFGDEHFHTCTHCKDLITIGLACSHCPRSCQARYHMHCARVVVGAAVDTDAALAARSGFPCPECRKPWNSKPIGPAVWRTILGDDAVDNSQHSAQDYQSYDQEEQADESDEEPRDTKPTIPRSSRQDTVHAVKTERTQDTYAALGDDDDDDDGEQDDVKPQRIFD